MSVAAEMNNTDLFMLDLRTPFDNYWFKTLIITLYSIVCVGCIVGKQYSLPAVRFSSSSTTTIIISPSGTDVQGGLIIMLINSITYLLTYLINLFISL